MSSYSFAFGPSGSYFLSTPIKWTSFGLPQKLRDALFADVGAKDPFVGLGPDDEYFYRRTTPLGDKWSTMKGEKSDTIVNWLNAKNADNDSKISVCYGPGQSWVGCTSQGAASWGGMPSSFDQNIRGFHPVMASLGVATSYVLVNGKGHIKWNLMGKYDLLDQILTNATSGIQMIALNPFAEAQFIVLFKNGMYRAFLPAVYRDTVASTIDAAQKHEAEIAAIVCQSMLDNQKMMNNFLLNMSNNMQF